MYPVTGLILAVTFGFPVEKVSGDRTDLGCLRYSAVSEAFI